MAKIRIVYKILPSDVNREILDGLIDKIRNKAVDLKYVVNDYRIEPIAFGLNALKILLTFEEENGKLDEFEQYLGSLPEVSSWEVVGMTRD